MIKEKETLVKAILADVYFIVCTVLPGFSDVYPSIREILRDEITNSVDAFLKSKGVV